LTAGVPANLGVRLGTAVCQPPMQIVGGHPSECRDPDFPRLLIEKIRSDSYFLDCLPRFLARSVRRGLSQGDFVCYAPQVRRHLPSCHLPSARLSIWEISSQRVCDPALLSLPPFFRRSESPTVPHFFGRAASCRQCFRWSLLNVRAPLSADFAPRIVFPLSVDSSS